MSRIIDPNGGLLLASREDMLQIARGLVPGVSHVNQFGVNTDVDAGTEDIWSGGGTWAAPTQPRVHTIVSASAFDDVGNIGAEEVTIVGLDANYAVATETIAMNGTSGVSTTRAYAMIHLMYVSDAGSGTINIGAITATAATDSTVTARIEVGMCRSGMAIYMVPAGSSGYVTGWGVSFRPPSTTGVAGTGILETQPFGGMRQTVHTKYLYSLGANYAYVDLTPPFVAPAKSILRVRATAESPNNLFSGWLNIIVAEDQ